MLIAEQRSGTQENADDLLLKISLQYEANGRRPKQGGVRIKISGSRKNRYTLLREPFIKNVIWEGAKFCPIKEFLRVSK